MARYAKQLYKLLGSSKSFVAQLLNAPRMPDASGDLIRFITIGESKVTNEALRAGWTSTYQIANVGRPSYALYKGRRDITTMTIAEIRKGMLGTKDTPKFLGACGRYQVVYVALKDLLRFGLPLDVKFDVHTQDVIGCLLLTYKRPDLGAYLLGVHDDVALAARDMALEWASVPTSSGATAYIDGFNKAYKGHTYAGLLNVLRDARSRIMQLRQSYEPALALWYYVKGTYSPK